MEELRQQLRSQTYELKKARDVCLLYEDDEQRLKEETKDLKRKLDEERRRSASFHLQVHGWATDSWQRHVYLKFLQVTLFTGGSHSSRAEGKLVWGPDAVLNKNRN